MNIFTSQLKKRQPQLDDDPWYQDWWDNEQINDVVMGALLAGHRVLSGGAVTAGTGLEADIAALAMQLGGGTTYPAIAGDTLALTAAAVGAEQTNWVYVSDAGVITVATTPPAGAYVPLALVDTNDTAVVRIADLRPMAPDISSRIHVATTKATPVDADESGWWDSITGALVRVPLANLRATLKTYFDTLYATDGAWITPTLVNGWRTYPGNPICPFQYKKLANGVVHVAALIDTANFTSSTICTLPALYRPGKPIIVVTYGGPIGEGSIKIDTNGVVSTMESPSSVHGFSITFKAEN